MELEPAVDRLMLPIMSNAAGASSPTSFAAPFRHSVFTVIWTATLVSNVGGWMYGAASGWLMTTLNPDPPVRAAGRRARRYFRQAQIFDRGRDVDHGSVGDLCGDGRIRLGYARQSLAVHLPDRRRRRAHHSGLAGHRAAACP